MEEIARVNQQLYGLRMQCRQAEEQFNALQTQVQEAEQHLHSLEAQQQRNDNALSATTNGLQATSLGRDTASSASSTDPAALKSSEHPLPREDYRRYGRQMILPEVGAAGQARLRQARVLIVGAGGLGCPAAAYLAGAGVGRLGLVDGDVVEMSNLHRQMAHSTDRIGTSKVESAYTYLQGLNPTIIYDRHTQHLTPTDALALFEQYDLVLDCTDHPITRYLISDACVLTGRPLVSASALKTEGQLIVLNNPPLSPGDSAGGPCYRCLFPKPPPSDTVQSCGEGGILGPVVGAMGVLQALEAIKMLTANIGTSQDQAVKPSMLMFSAYSNPQFRSIRMRGRRLHCATCSSAASIQPSSLLNGMMDYAAFCGLTSSASSVQGGHRISAVQLRNAMLVSRPLIIDTREKTQFNICSLRGTINIPWTGDKQSWLKKSEQHLTTSSSPDIVLVCRHGNDSQIAAHALQGALGQHRNVCDVRDGFDAWRRDVDPQWPEY